MAFKNLCLSELRFQYLRVKKGFIELLVDSAIPTTFSELRNLRTSRMVSGYPPL